MRSAFPPSLTQLHEPLRASASISCCSLPPPVAASAFLTPSQQRGAMASKRRDLCPNSQEELLAERNANGTARSKREECPYCIFLIGAHNKHPAANPSALNQSSVRAADPVVEKKGEEDAEDEGDVCCICLEPLWSAVDGEGTKPGGLAELACRHAMHSECLGKHTHREVEIAKASGIAANGIGAFGPQGQFSLRCSDAPTLSVTSKMNAGL